MTGQSKSKMIQWLVPVIVAILTFWFSWIVKPTVAYEGRMSKVETEIVSLDRRVSCIETKLDNIDSKLNLIYNEVRK